MRVDLNCDMGEGYPSDARIMPLVTSANVACGFHASDPGTMRRTVRLARDQGVAVGAHPSFPDWGGFGRRFMAASPDEVRDDVTYQIRGVVGVLPGRGRPPHPREGAWRSLQCVGREPGPGARHLRGDPSHRSLAQGGVPGGVAYGRGGA